MHTYLIIAITVGLVYYVGQKLCDFQLKVLKHTIDNPCFFTFHWTGVLVENPDTKELRTVRAYTICFTADLPARASVQNMVQYNGFYGCSFCEQPGETVKTSLRGHVHTFQFDASNPGGPSRKHDVVITHAIQALQKSESVCCHANIILLAILVQRLPGTLQYNLDKQYYYNSRQYGVIFLCYRSVVSRDPLA